MSGTTYSRTSGHAILPGTWEYIRRKNALPGSLDHEALLDPAHRYSYDSATQEQRRQYDLSALQALTAPPDFLVSNQSLAQDAAESVVSQETGDDSGSNCYPGAAYATQALNGYPADGWIEQFGEDSVKVAAKKLLISSTDVIDALRNFSGAVIFAILEPGTVLHRAVGLTIPADDQTQGGEKTLRGSIVGQLVGKYWEAQAPNTYASSGEWQSKTAQINLTNLKKLTNLTNLANQSEWGASLSGGYVRVVLAKPVAALMGMTAMQKLQGSSGKVLPGGATQYFVPRLRESDLAQPLSTRSLQDVILPAQFGGAT